MWQAGESTGSVGGRRGYRQCGRQARVQAVWQARVQTVWQAGEGTGGVAGRRGYRQCDRQARVQAVWQAGEGSCAVAGR